MTERADVDAQLSDGPRELAECYAGPVAGGDVSGEFVVAAAQILDECVPGGHDPRGLAAFQSAHRPQPRFQPAVIDLGRPPQSGNWL